jgi:hypothetical protein
MKLKKYQNQKGDYVADLKNLSVDELAEIITALEMNDSQLAVELKKLNKNEKIEGDL